MDVLKSLLEKGILISPEVVEDPLLLKALTDFNISDLKNATVVNREFIETFMKSKKHNESEDFDEAKTSFVNSRVIFSYNKKPGKITVNDFVAHFNRRYESLSAMLRQRQELQRATSINRLKNKADRESAAVIGLVYDKVTTKNNNLLIKLEDQSGSINVLFGEKKKELLTAAKEIVLDELIGVEGILAGNFLLANQIFFPDIPLLKELKKSPVEEFLIIVGDPHFGSKAFLKKEFDEFIEWINQRKGSPEQKEIAAKTKYLVIIGDVVEGVGIYPGQEADLEIKDIKEQYDVFSDYLRRVPSHITIFVCPGNHDAGRLSEPQPPLLHKYTESLKKLSNVILVSNPAFINVGATPSFSGFDVLLYHGFSLIYYSENVDSIRQQGGQQRPDLIMKRLLQMRHLAPTHKSNLYTPDSEFDPLVISRIPDFFITGHIHRISVSNYKNITLINSSCWTDITENQEERGIQPQPARVPVINLQTREVKVINFFKQEKKTIEDSEAKNNSSEPFKEAVA